MSDWGSRCSLAGLYWAGSLPKARPSLYCAAKMTAICITHLVLCVTFFANLLPSLLAALGKLHMILMLQVWQHCRAAVLSCCPCQRLLQLRHSFISLG